MKEYDLGKKTFNVPAINPLWGNRQAGHLYTRRQSHSHGQTLITLSEEDINIIPELFTNKQPKGKLFRIATIATEDRKFNDLGWVVINVENETVAYATSYDWDSEEYGYAYWEKPFKYKRLIIQKGEEFDIE
jgi:hypothetical protein